eukprot:TRINITY_DN20980_c0_g1_i1.p1 TRINITY_DN20980_c0_g1~~TRINITY_DN20980_c0_g1_i1.p1  ORF type:complete len:508 (+),score=235.78 TRINITY_DN20980_c0_g1_i1:84-1607(+)
MPDPAPTSGGLQYMESESTHLKKSIGTESNWGWSPTFDVLEYLPQAQLDGDVEEPINILLDGAGDLRHVFSTVARMKKRTARPVHFYIWEPNLKHHARHAFFLEWFFDQVDVSHLGLEESAAEFLELYGNTLLRDGASAALKRLSKRAANTVRGGKSKLADHVDYETFIKLREVDWVAEQLDAWNAEKSEFNVDVQWDNRVREDVGDRYDSKANMMDWDFNNGIMHHTAHLRWPEYKDWRHTGIGYDWGRVNPRRAAKYEYKNVNKSLAVFADRKRSKGAYVGDVRCGPYFTFGIDTPWQDLKAKQHDGSYKYSNGIIALHTVRAMIYERCTGEPWEWGEFKVAWDAPDHEQPQKTKTLATPPPLPDFKVFTIGLDPARMHLLLKTKFDEPIKFDAMFLGAQSAQNFTEERAAMLKDKGFLAMEALKFCVYMKDDQKDLFAAKLREIAGAQGWTPAVELQTRLHREAPAFHLPFARENSKMTDAQKRDKARFETPWLLAFTKGSKSP